MNIINEIDGLIRKIYKGDHFNIEMQILDIFQKILSSIEIDKNGFLEVLRLSEEAMKTKNFVELTDILEFKLKPLINQY